MTVANDTRSVEYTCNGVTTSFPTTFPFLEEDHLQVVLIDGTLVETPQTLGVDFSVTGGGGETGNVVFGTAPANDLNVRIDRVVPTTQPDDYRSQGTFEPGTLENGLDRLTMIAQQLEDDIAAGQGETNTGANLGTGVGVYDSKSGASLRFRSIGAAHPSASVALNGSTIEIDNDPRYQFFDDFILDPGLSGWNCYLSAAERIAAMGNDPDMTNAAGAASEAIDVEGGIIRLRSPALIADAFNIMAASHLARGSRGVVFEARVAGHMSDDCKVRFGLHYWPTSKAFTAIEDYAYFTLDGQATDFWNAAVGTAGGGVPDTDSAASAVAATAATYHVFRIEVTSDGTAFYIDDTEVLTSAVTPTDDKPLQPFFAIATDVEPDAAAILIDYVLVRWGARP